MTRQEFERAIGASRDPSPRREDVVYLLSLVRHDRDRVSAVVDELQTQLPTTNEPIGKENLSRIRDVKVDIQSLLDGPHSSIGAQDDRVAGRFGKPGLNDLRRLVERLEAKLLQVDQVLEQWPTPGTTHMYRYVGREYKHRDDEGNFVRPGQILPLTQNQAKALSDRFELVVEDSEVTNIATA